MSDFADKLEKKIESRDEIDYDPVTEAMNRALESLEALGAALEEANDEE